MSCKLWQPVHSPVVKLFGGHSSPIIYHCNSRFSLSFIKKLWNKETGNANQYLKHEVEYEIQRITHITGISIKITTLLKHWVISSKNPRFLNVFNLEIPCLRSKLKERIKAYINIHYSHIASHGKMQKEKEDSITNTVANKTLCINIGKYSCHIYNCSVTKEIIKHKYINTYINKHLHKRNYKNYNKTSDN